MFAGFMNASGEGGVPLVIRLAEGGSEAGSDPSVWQAREEGRACVAAFGGAEAGATS